MTKTENLKTEFTKNILRSSVSCKGIYKDGCRTGEWKYYLANGLLKAIGNYVVCKMTEEWKCYRENGKLMQTGSFDNEIKTGVRAGCSMTTQPAVILNVGTVFIGHPANLKQKK